MTTQDEQHDITTLTVADVALESPQAVETLTRYNLDYCCDGKKSFIDACTKEGLNPETIWNEVLKAKAGSVSENHMHFETCDINLLIEFIEQHHHQYVRDSVPKIQELLDKVCQVHGDDNPTVQSVKDDFNDLANELIDHLVKEEKVLFPAIRKFKAQSSIHSCSLSPIGIDPQEIISVMEGDHHHAGNLIKSLRILTQNYTPPTHSCPTFALAYQLLQEFDNDLMQHVHIENNILFPKVKRHQV